MTKKRRRYLLPLHNTFHMTLACAFNNLNKIEAGSQVAEVEIPTITVYDNLPVGIIDADLGRRCRADDDVPVSGIGIDGSFACQLCQAVGVSVNP